MNTLGAALAEAAAERWRDHEGAEDGPAQAKMDKAMARAFDRLAKKLGL